MNAAKLPLGRLIDKLSSLREQRRALAEKDEALAKEYGEIEAQLIQRFEAEGMDKATGKTATASVSSTVVANVTDWDKLYAFIKKKNYFHLLQRRVSDPAFRELQEQSKNGVPGVEPFVKKRLNLRNL